MYDFRDHQSFIRHCKSPQHPLNVAQAAAAIFFPLWESFVGRALFVIMSTTCNGAQSMFALVFFSISFIGSSVVQMRGLDHRNLNKERICDLWMMSCVTYKCLMFKL